ncbi:shikimate dehydrogenase [Tissierella sp. MSJ-40]|uniref:Shikimate dehydrogenase (NADP(+)) n=1 Tax=Tissierella simiarum TaxID=2841534 RepID=A0ABS6E3Z4_9FIRM|nr:shikimate dehydrogenase [Tissierella simiarum]MBU5437502.1 shikimate dehydrogenase [Tissierella simiarum]
MVINWNTDLFCLIGHPVSKTLSPIIHNKFFELINKNSIYLAFDIEKDNLFDVLKTFKAMNVKGFNVTIPHKIEIMDYLDSISEEAKLIGAVNTVKNENGQLVGYNTDGIGFLKSLTDNNIKIKDKTILLLGAGGAAYAIGVTLSLEGASKIYINNRSIENSNNLAKKIKSLNKNVYLEVGDLSLNNINKLDVDIIINTTSIGMYPKIEMVPIEISGFSQNILVYDIIYKPNKTKLLIEAEMEGYRTISGLSMLINQALYSQKIWNGFELEEIQRYVKELEGILTYHVE